MKTNSKGFTLIELLVVIAIIGILSTIAMTSLNGARKKAADASFKSSVSSIQAVAVICCDSTVANPLRGTTAAPGPGGLSICSGDASVAGVYPPATAIGASTVTNCSGGDFTITVLKPPSFSGTLNSGTCTATSCTFA